MIQLKRGGMRLRGSYAKDLEPALEFHVRLCREMNVFVLTDTGKGVSMAQAGVKGKKLDASASIRVVPPVFRSLKGMGRRRFLFFEASIWRLRFIP